MDSYRGILDGWAEITGGTVRDKVHACNCLGPRSGEPLCPCAMRNVQIVDGRYKRIEDLGPAPTGKAK